MAAGAAWWATSVVAEAVLEGADAPAALMAETR